MNRLVIPSSTAECNCDEAYVQLDLFGAGTFPAIPGLTYETEFLSIEEESLLLDIIGTLPLHFALYKGFESRTRIISYGGLYDFDTGTVKPSPSLDERLVPLRSRVAAWIGVPVETLVQVLVAEYAVGTQLGWHRDVPEYETIAGLSLGSAATLRFRPYPPNPVTNRNSVSLQVEARSIYRMEGEARWGWQHTLPPVKHKRWSITFRTQRRGRCKA